jgi:putative ABC transport system permease protein
VFDDRRILLPVGTELTLGTNGPAFKLVGFARSVSQTADAWVAPGQVAVLTHQVDYQMLYRFGTAATTAQMTANRAAVASTVPAGSVTGSRSWLDVRLASHRNTALFVPFLVAFGLLGMVTSMLIVGNVVAAAVGAGTRRIGILKAIGFTPAEVTRAYVAQALVPAAIGTAAGVLAGTLLTFPVLSQTDTLYATATSGVSPLVDVIAIVGVLGLVAVTALLAALRAGRLRTVDALAVGRTPYPGRGRWAARFTGRLPLPRSISLGLARPFARPLRAAAMVAAIVFGASSVTFALGLGWSLNAVQRASQHDTAQVTVGLYPPPPAAGGDPATPPRPGPMEPVDVAPAKVQAAIAAQPGTAGFYGTVTTEMAVAGVTGSTDVVSFTGDGRSSGYAMIAGRWFDRPGEAVVPTPFLATTGTRIGDAVTLTDQHGKGFRITIVGEVFDTADMEVFTDAASVGGPAPDEYHVNVADGTDVDKYLSTLNTALAPLGIAADRNSGGGTDAVIVVVDSLTSLLTLMLLVIAALGVLNAVVLDTRERVHDLGVHKALGMTPKQTSAMVVASVVVVGVAGGVLGVPLGLLLHSIVIPAMGRTAGTHLPTVVLNVFQPVDLILLGLGGLAIAVAGALLPAGWAARIRTATALRTE